MTRKPRRSPSSRAQAGALADLGRALRGRGDGDGARRCFEAALRLDPEDLGVCNDLGVLHHQAGRLAEARSCFERTLARCPEHLAALNNLAVVVHGGGELAKAGDLYRRSIALKPDSAETLSNLGIALLQRGSPEAAYRCLHRACRLAPGAAKLRVNLAVAAREAGRLDETIRHLRGVLAACPGLAEAHHDLGMALLAAGELGEGWEHYEWRWRTAQMQADRRAFRQPQWSGREAPGRTLLVWAEQGLGDTLQFCRYVPLAARRGLSVIVEVQPPLRRLLATLPGADAVIARGRPLPDFDCHCPMLSLPGLFATGLDDIPAVVPYLGVDPAAREAWRRRLGHLPGLKVGLVWAGNPRRHSVELAAVDRRRSIAPEDVAVLAEVPGVSLVSLQKDGPRAPPSLPIFDPMAEVDDFADTAALVAGLDLVISVDTSVAHLAGALGRPVWILSRFDGCWRWLSGRDDSPWYPTARLFRQVGPGGWSDVLSRAAAALQRLVRAQAPS